MHEITHAFFVQNGKSSFRSFGFISYERIQKYSKSKYMVRLRRGVVRCRRRRVRYRASHGLHPRMCQHCTSLLKFLHSALRIDNYVARLWSGQHDNDLLLLGFPPIKSSVIVPEGEFTMFKRVNSALPMKSSGSGQSAETA